MTGWIEITAVVGVVVIILLVAIGGWTRHRRRTRSRPVVEMDDSRRQRLREIAASYQPKKADRKDKEP